MDKEYIKTFDYNKFINLLNMHVSDNNLNAGTMYISDMLNILEKSTINTHLKPFMIGPSIIFYDNGDYKLSVRDGKISSVTKYTPISTFLGGEEKVVNKGEMILDEKMDKWERLKLRLKCVKDFAVSEYLEGSDDRYALGYSKSIVNTLRMMKEEEETDNACRMWKEKLNEQETREGGACKDSV